MNACDFACLNSQGVTAPNSCYYTANQTDIIIILFYYVHTSLNIASNTITLRTDRLYMSPISAV